MGQTVSVSTDEMGILIQHIEDEVSDSERLALKIQEALENCKVFDTPECADLKVSAEQLAEAFKQDAKNIAGSTEFIEQKKQFLIQSGQAKPFTSITAGQLESVRHLIGGGNSTGGTSKGAMKNVTI